ncbi:putative YeiH family sulfate export transporter [Pararobbsia alpina]|uniref:YeiH family protein n=1 Tax=Pararobbsia alpina TaxID=621374 RepID=UPI0039A6BF30
MNSVPTTAPASAAPGFFRAHRGELNGFLFVALFAAAVTQISAIPAISRLGLSSLIIGIASGVLYGNVVREAMPESWASGVNFAARRLLRIAVAFYGLRISFQEIATVGVQGLAVSATIVIVTLVAGTWLGTRLLKLDREEALLTAAGSAICGAAAVLAFESTLQSKPHKSAIAVGTVVLFGTLSMFVYPALLRVGLIHLDTVGTGLFFGGTIHEVAQVVGAASAVSPEATHIATIVKMTRVLMLVPVLLVLTVWLARRDASNAHGSSHASSHATVESAHAHAAGNHPARRKIAVPWFAIGFLALVGVNSLHLLPDTAVHSINTIDTFALTMAMTALGIETRFAQIRQAGPRALLFGLGLYVWLIAGGLGVTYLAEHLL